MVILSIELEARDGLQFIVSQEERSGRVGWRLAATVPGATQIQLPLLSTGDVSFLARLLGAIVGLEAPT